VGSPELVEARKVMAAFSFQVGREGGRKDGSPKYSRRLSVHLLHAYIVFILFPLSPCLPPSLPPSFRLPQLV
jgi:hypothetical protein